MAHYYANRPSKITPSVPATENPTIVSPDAPVLTEFDKHRKTLLTADSEEGWAAELRRYLGTMQHEVEKDTDLVEWWQVSNNLTYHVIIKINNNLGRTMHNCTRHSVKLRSTFFPHRHHPLPVSEYFQAVNKLRQTAVHAWDQLFLNSL